MIKLTSGVDINNLIDDIRIFSWQAADILLYYSKLLENANDRFRVIIDDLKELKRDLNDSPRERKKQRKSKPKSTSRD